MIPVFFVQSGLQNASSLNRKSDEKYKNYVLKYFKIGLLSTFMIAIITNLFSDYIIYLFAIGIFGSTGNILLTMSIRKADVSLVTPVKYLSLIFAILSGIFIFGEAISFSTLFGALLIIISTAIIFRREAVKKVKTTIVRQV